MVVRHVETELALARAVMPDPITDVRSISRNAPASRSGTKLRALLTTIDIVALLIGWSFALLPLRAFTAPSLAAAAMVVTATLACLAAIASRGLYQSRVSALRSQENARLMQAIALGALVALGTARLFDYGVSAFRFLVGVISVLLVVTLARSAFQHWLRAARTGGRFMRSILVVGLNDEALELDELLREHPELGFRVDGFVGDEARARQLVEDEARARQLVEDDAYVGELGELAVAAGAVGATGILVVASALSADELDLVLRDAMRAGLHIQLSSGLRGVSVRRVHPFPLSHEPMFYVEPPDLSRWNFVAKRSLDVTLASVGLVLSLPVLIAAAIAIKFEDRGPILFRQTRIGRDGKPFVFFKLRTMGTDADAQQMELVDRNVRVGGPLFKAMDDPRRTRVGRLLEIASVDELPQFWNVLNGTMSLVGPRPALPQEVAQFDSELLNRHQMLPGITGLWQVEGRDNPSFNAYRRLDLFYLDNWSVSFDLGIIVSTVGATLARVVRSLSRRNDVIELNDDVINLSEVDLEVEAPSAAS